MGRGRGEPCLFGKPIWGGLVAFSICLAIIMFIVGGVNLGGCTSAANDCKDNNACSALCVLNGADSNCRGGCTDIPDNAPDDCDDMSSNTLTLYCKWTKACSCNTTRGGTAAISFGVIFLILSCVCCCGVVPCLCFDTPVAHSAPAVQGTPVYSEPAQPDSGVQTAKI